MYGRVNSLVLDYHKYEAAMHARTHARTHPLDPPRDLRERPSSISMQMLTGTPQCKTISDFTVPRATRHWIRKRICVRCRAATSFVNTRKDVSRIRHCSRYAISRRSLRAMRTRATPWSISSGFLRGRVKLLVNGDRTNSSRIWYENRDDRWVKFWSR